MNAPHRAPAPERSGGYQLLQVGDHAPRELAGLVDEMENLRVAATTKPTLEEVKDRREEILRIAVEHGTWNVRVFGSVARGTASKDSYIDLLIDFVGPPPDDFDYYAVLVEIQEGIQQLLGHSVHVVHLGNPEAPQARRIMRDAVAL